MLKINKKKISIIKIKIFSTAKSMGMGTSSSKIHLFLYISKSFVKLMILDIFAFELPLSRLLGLNATKMTLIQFLLSWRKKSLECRAY